MTCKGDGPVRFSRALEKTADSTRSIPHCLALSLLGIEAVMVAKCPVEGLGIGDPENSRPVRARGTELMMHFPV